MGKEKPIASVFIDTNILKFSAVKKHVYRPKMQSLNWGGKDHEVIVHEPVTLNSIHGISNEVQRRDAVFLGMVAYAEVSGWLSFHYHREVEHESWGLPGIIGPSGKFFDCKLSEVPDPASSQSRMIFGGGKTAKEHTLEFVSSITHPRYLELTRMTGAYQGKDRPLNLNQALDAYHLWCAESAKMDYFLTMDYNLKKVVRLSKRFMPVTIVTPHQLLQQVVPKFGILGASVFLWKGYFYARSRVGFTESAGWT